MDAQKQEELLRLTREVIDIKTEKKSMNKDFNERIKNLELQIAECVKE